LRSDPLAGYRFSAMASVLQNVQDANDALALSREAVASKAYLWPLRVSSPLLYLSCFAFCGRD
jgi:hypothetical protein